MSDRERIVLEARRWVGTPVHHLGRLRGVGVDCVGVLLAAAAAIGRALPDPGYYGQAPAAQPLLACTSAVLRPIALDEAGPGDVILFWLEDPRQPKHLGIRTENGIIHAWTQVGRVVEHGLSHGWERRMHSAWRIPGVS